MYQNPASPESKRVWLSRCGKIYRTRPIIYRLIFSNLRVYCNGLLLLLIEHVLIITRAVLLRGEHGAEGVIKRNRDQPIYVPHCIPSPRVYVITLEKIAEQIPSLAECLGEFDKLLRKPITRIRCECFFFCVETITKV